MRTLTSMVTMVSYLWVAFICQAIAGATCFLHLPQPALRGSSGAGAGLAAAGPAGSALFLTPFIRSGQIAEGRRQARVKLAGVELDSYAGFFTVNETYNSNQFFWYFPPVAEAVEKAPVIVWLQGGPGCSSLFGLFTENGPLAVYEDSFELRKVHWALNHHAIYIDNPVGAGFSFTNHEQGYCNDETQVGEQLHSTLTQFFQLFPELQKNKFFLTGESYAGKYVPAAGYTILKKNPTAETKINLQGLVIGGAYCEPFHRNRPTKYLTLTPKIRTDDYIRKLDTPEVRKAIHVGEYEFDDFNYEVYTHLSEDKSRSIGPWVSELLDHYPMVFYNGDLDDTVPYEDTLYFLQHLRFNGSEEYKKAKRQEWQVDGQLAGYVRNGRTLTDILVLGATHFVPTDQPARAWGLITRVTHGKGF